MHFFSTVDNSTSETNYSSSKDITNIQSNSHRGPFRENMPLGVYGPYGTGWQHPVLQGQSSSPSVQGAATPTPSECSTPQSRCTNSVPQACTFHSITLDPESNCSSPMSTLEGNNNFQDQYSNCIRNPSFQEHSSELAALKHHHHHHRGTGVAGTSFRQAVAFSGVISPLSSPCSPWGSAASSQNFELSTASSAQSNYHVSTISGPLVPTLPLLSSLPSQPQSLTSAPLSQTSIGLLPLSPEFDSPVMLGFTSHFSPLSKTSEIECDSHLNLGELESTRPRRRRRRNRRRNRNRNRNKGTKEDFAEVGETEEFEEDEIVEPSLKHLSCSAVIPSETSSLVPNMHFRSLAVSSPCLPTNVTKQIP